MGEGSGPRHLLGVDVQKAVEGSSIETVKPPGEGLFGAKTRPAVVRWRMQA